jgi:hypothetical protein
MFAAHCVVEVFNSVALLAKVVWRKTPVIPLLQTENREAFLSIRIT